MFYATTKIKQIIENEEKLNLYKIDPPYPWINAYLYINIRYKEMRKDASIRIRKYYPYYSDDDIKIIQISIPKYMILSDIAIYKGMEWDTFKNNLYAMIKRNKDTFPYSPECIQNIAITNNPHAGSPSVNENIEDVFTIIPDNVVVFVNQIKINDKWIYLD